MAAPVQGPGANTAHNMLSLENLILTNARAIFAADAVKLANETSLDASDICVIGVKRVPAGKIIVHGADGYPLYQAVLYVRRLPNSKNQHEPTVNFASTAATPLNAVLSTPAGGAGSPMSTSPMQRDARPGSSSIHPIGISETEEQSASTPMPTGPPASDAQQAAQRRIPLKPAYEWEDHELDNSSRPGWQVFLRDCFAAHEATREILALLTQETMDMREEIKKANQQAMEVKETTKTVTLRTVCEGPVALSPEVTLKSLLDWTMQTLAFSV